MLKTNQVRNLLISVLLITGFTPLCSKPPKTNTSKTSITETNNLTERQKEARSQTNLGNTYYYTDNYTMAIACFNKAIELDSNFADAYYNRGNIYYNTGEFDKAISDYNKTLELNPKKIDAMVDIYTAYKTKNDISKADYWRKQTLKYKDRLSEDQLRELGVSTSPGRLPG